MKRCPECEFLYEDEQDRCDMDGTELRVTGFLPPLPLPKRVVQSRAKPIWDGLTIPLLVIVIIGSVLVVLYRAAPPTFSSSSGLKKIPASNASEAGKLPAPQPSPQVIAEPAAASMPAEPSEVESAPKPSTVNRSVEKKSLNGGLEIHFQVGPAPLDSSPKAVTDQASPAQPTPPKPAASSRATSVYQPRPPASPAPQPKPQSENEDSKLKSIFKKAGRILKKPF